MYKTIVLALVEQRPELHDQLRSSRTLLATLNLYASQLKASHEAWKDRLSKAKAETDEIQLASEAMEMAEVALKVPYVQVLLTTYGVPDEEAASFVALTEEANQPGWWQRFHDVLPEWFSLYVSLEGAAGLIRSYEPHFVPGLLQTEDYARGVLVNGAIGQAQPEDIERHVALRMQRQDLLTRTDLSRLKVCPQADGGCGWFFLDQSRNSSRRWCTMDDCGTHAKSRRLTAKRRATRLSGAAG